MLYKIYIIFLYFFVLSSIYSECILLSSYNLNTKKWQDDFSCPDDILKSKHSSGSIFKIFLVMYGYYSNILKEKDLETINKKMMISDNDYFLKLINKINKNNFILFCNEHLKDYFYPNSFNEKNFTDDFSYLYGGKSKFYPEEVLNWFKNLSLDNRQFSKTGLESIKRNDLNIEYYGKSGTWDGSALFCGIIKRKSIQVLCVLNKYKPPHWKYAKNKSFETFKKKMLAGI